MQAKVLGAIASSAIAVGSFEVKSSTRRNEKLHIYRPRVEQRKEKNEKYEHLKDLEAGYAEEACVTSQVNGLRKFEGSVNW